MCEIDWNLVIQCFNAIGTVAVSILAIWGNYFKYRLVPPEIVIVPSNIKGTVTKFTNGPRVIYYHLEVQNTRSWSTARSCHVRLRSISKKLTNGDFKNLPLPVIPSFIWAPAELTPPVINLSHEQTLDFGRVIENDDKFSPVLNLYPNNFDGVVKKDECVRYSLEVVAEGFKTNRLQVFEVAWNGKWSDNLDTMSNNLTIKEIKENDGG
jgi:hypothetical protein